MVRVAVIFCAFNTHMVVKFFRALATKELVIVKKVASRGILNTAVDHLGKGVTLLLTLLTSKELEGQKDMMSYNICERASSPNITVTD